LINFFAFFVWAGLDVGMDYNWDCCLENYLMGSFGATIGGNGYIRYGLWLILFCFLSMHTVRSNGIPS
jgi:hypothetical protein